MKQEFYNLQINTSGQKLYEFTNDTIQWICQNKFPQKISFVQLFAFAKEFCSCLANSSSALICRSRSTFNRGGDNLVLLLLTLV